MERDLQVLWNTEFSHPLFSRVVFLHSEGTGLVTVGGRGRVRV